MRNWWKLPQALGMALGLYTAIPGFARWDDSCAGLLMPALPVVGLLLGLIWRCVAWAAAAWLPPWMAAVALALSMPCLTGFFHLDGYMDVADAMLSARPQEEKRRILKDPHIGAFAAIALICLLLVQLASMATLLERGQNLGLLVLLPVLSRGASALLLMTIPPMPGSQYGSLAHAGATRGRLLFCGACCALSLLVAAVLDIRSGAACLAGAVVAVWLGLRASRALGGMNGDVAGCVICCAEAFAPAIAACL